MWGVMQERMYKKKIWGVDELREHVAEEWGRLD